MKPSSLPNIHPGCTIQIIDDTTNPPMWKTIGECFDTINTIRRMMDANNIKTAWIRDCLGDRRYVTITA